MWWKFPLATLAITFAYLAYDAFFLGWERSTARRILKPSASTKEDLMYSLFVFTSLGKWLTLLLSFGIGWWAGNKVLLWCNWKMISEWHPVAQFMIIAVADSFFGYWHHRLMHTKWLWEIHKVHHAATEFNGITSFRNHPIDGAISTPWRAFIAAAFGAQPLPLAVYALVNIVYQIAVHSDVQWGRGWFGRWIVIDPSRHRIHHSSEERHYNKNFASLTLLDRIFGTYYEPDSHPKIGFEDDHAHNSGKPALGIWLVYRRWIGGLFKRGG